MREILSPPNKASVIEILNLIVSFRWRTKKSIILNLVTTEVKSIQFLLTKKHHQSSKNELQITNNFELIQIGLIT